jgi:hypothetical protein
MAKQLFSNNGSSVLTAVVIPAEGVISITPGDGSLFSDPGGSGDWELITLVGSNGIEIVKMIDRVDDSLTIERGQEGTAALSFSIGEKVSARITKGTMETLRDSTSASGNGYGLVPSREVDLGSADNSGQTDWLLDTEGAMIVRADFLDNFTISMGLFSPLSAGNTVQNKLVLMIGETSLASTITVDLQRGANISMGLWLDELNGPSEFDRSYVVQHEVLVFDISVTNFEKEDGLFGTPTIIVSKLSQGNFIIDNGEVGGE